jgi:hypothetical protein
MTDIIIPIVLTPSVVATCGFVGPIVRAAVRS